MEEELQRAVIFFDQFGVNDYMYFFLQGKQPWEIDMYVPLVTQSIKNMLKKLIKMGASNLLVSGSLPMGCLPAYLTLFNQDQDSMKYDAKNCHIGLNAFSVYHNNRLKQSLEELSQEYPHVRIVYADYYNSFMGLLRNHVMLGFKKQSLLKACCGSGGAYNFDATLICGDHGGSVCSDPTAYAHWDGFHLTEKANKHIVEAITKRSKFVYPESINFQQSHGFC